MPGSPIYSVDIQPSKNSERFATGGLDCQIRIWAMKHLRTTKGASVAVEERDLLQADPLLLCTLTNHQGWLPRALAVGDRYGGVAVDRWVRLLCTLRSLEAGWHPRHLGISSPRLRH